MRSKMSETKSMSGKNSMNGMKGMKWIVVLLAVFLVAGAFVGAAGATDGDPTINTFTVNDGNSATITAGDTVTFAFTAENADGCTFNIDYGDNSTVGTGVTTGEQHTYGTAASSPLTATLKLMDGEAVKASKTVSITVTAPISEVAVTGVKEPVGGNEPAEDASSATNGIKSVVASWGNVTAFEAEKKYTVTVTITPKDGYKFATDPKPSVTINGNNAENVTVVESTLTASYQFTAPGKTQIKNIGLSIFKTPEKGDSASNVPITTNNENLKVVTKWVKDGETTPFTGMFEYNTKYVATAEITIDPDKTGAYEFKESVEVIYPSGATETTTSPVTPSDGKVTVTMSFTTGGKPEIKSITVTGITAPALGKDIEPQSPVISSTDQSGHTGDLSLSTPSDFKWMKGDAEATEDEFSEGTYKAVFTITHNDNVTIKEGAKVKVGDKEGTYSNSTHKATISYTLGKTEIDSIGVSLTAAPAGGSAAPAITLTDTTNLRMGNSGVSWYEGYASTTKLTDTTSLKYNTEYKAVFAVLIKNDDTHKFANSVSVSSTPNCLQSGSAAAKDPDDPDKVTVTLKFKTAASNELESVALTMNAPAIGSPASTTASTYSLAPSETSARYTVKSLSWEKLEGTNKTSMSTTDTFAAGGEYIATIVLSVTDPATSSVTFKSGITKANAKVNGSEAMETPTISADNKELTLKYKFPKLTTQINTVSVTVTAPSEGATVTGKSDVKATETSANYTVTSLSWYEGTSTTALGSTAKFEKGKDYTAEIKLTAKQNYVFKTGMTVSDAKVNSSNASEAPTYASSNTILTVKYKFVGSTTEITSVSLTMNPPTVGNSVSTTVSTFSLKASESSAKYEVVSISWYDDSGSSALSSSKKFEAGKKYTVLIELKPKDGYTFASGMKKSAAKVNSNSADADPSITNSNKTLKFKYTFPELTVTPVITKFSASPTSAVIKINESFVTVTFTYEFTGEYEYASLSYGDGFSDILTSASGTKPHNYSSTGSKTATLTVRGKDGKDYPRTVSLTVSKEELTASFTASPSSGEAPLAVNFTGTTAGNVSSWIWDFGDGSIGSYGKNVSHTFETPGSYNVTLKVTLGNETSSRSQKITVTKKGSSKGDDDDEKEPFRIGDTEVPSIFDIIAEFVHLLQSLFDFENHPLFPGSDE